MKFLFKDMFKRLLKFLGILKVHCTKCDGTGQVTQWATKIGSMYEGCSSTCKTCNGKGYL